MACLGPISARAFYDLETVLPSLRTWLHAAAFTMTSLGTMIVSVVPWLGYPFAVFSLFMFEKKILDITRVEKELQALEKNIEGGLEVPKTEFFDTFICDFDF